MNPKDLEILLNEHHANFAQLKKLIVSMDLMPSLSKGSFEPLTEKILQQLEKDIDFEKLKNAIEFELCVTYGLYIDEFNSEEITILIMDWWKNH